MQALWSAVLTLGAATFCWSTPSWAAEPARYDVVVYGGTSAGIAAAVQVARMGRQVVLLEPGDHLGGLTSGGLGFTDSGDKRVIGGIAREFYRRVKQHYDQPGAWRFERPEQCGQYRPEDDAIWTFEPRVAEQTFERMLAELQIPVLRRQRLDRASRRHLPRSPDRVHPHGERTDRGGTDVPRCDVRR